MRRRRSGMWVAGSAGALVVLLAGCTGGGERPPAGPTGAGTADAGLSPLGPYLRYLKGAGPELTAEQLADMQREQERLTAQCMKAKGFDYTPVEPQTPSEAVADDDLPPWDSLEFAQQFGYGATTFQDLSVIRPDEEWVDPNQEYVDAMTDAERLAYETALWGSYSTPAPGGAVEQTGLGCQGEANAQVFGANSKPSDEAMELIEEMGSIYENASDDPRITGARDAWVGCMADAGYDFDAPEDAGASIWEAYGQLTSGPTVDDGAMAELREREIATAVADRTCIDETRLAETTEQVNREAEQEFVDAHRAELDALVERGDR